MPRTLFLHTDNTDLHSRSYVRSIGMKPHVALIYDFEKWGG